MVAVQGARCDIYANGCIRRLSLSHGVAARLAIRSPPAVHDLVFACDETAIVMRLVHAEVACLSGEASRDGMLLLSWLNCKWLVAIIMLIAVTADHVESVSVCRGILVPVTRKAWR